MLLWIGVSVSLGGQNLSMFFRVLYGGKNFWLHCLGFFLWGSEILNIFRYLSWNLNENKMLKYNRWKWSLFVASHHADVLRGSSRVRGAGTRDEPLRKSTWEATCLTHNREKGNVHILPNFSKFQFLSAFVAHILLDRRGIKALSAPIKNEKIARVFCLHVATSLSL